MNHQVGTVNIKIPLSKFGGLKVYYDSIMFAVGLHPIYGETESVKWFMVANESSTIREQKRELSWWFIECTWYHYIVVNYKDLHILLYANNFYA